MRTWLWPALSLVAVATAVVVVRAQGTVVPTPRPPGAQPGAPGAPPVPTGTGLIAGQIVDAVSGQPTGGALVTLAGGSAGGTRVLTDTEGHFVFENLPKGSFTLTATKPGYSTGTVGRRRPDGDGRPVVLGDGDRVTSLVLPVWKFGVVSGTVLDEANEPVVGQRVYPLQRKFVAGRPMFTGGEFVTTDDRGAYRLRSLLPGDYVIVVPMSENAIPLDRVQQFGLGRDTSDGSLSNAISAAAMDGDLPGSNYVLIVGDQLRSYWYNTAVPPAPGADGVLTYQTTFFPSASSASEARLITITSGDERSGVDFSMRLTTTVTISGRVLGPDGPVPNVGLQLFPANAENVTVAFSTARTMPRADGTFTFLGVPPGQYMLKLVRSPNVVPAPPQMAPVMGPTGVVEWRVNFNGDGGPDPNGPTLWARMPLTVGATPIANLDVVMQRGFRLRGRVEFAGDATKPTPAQLSRISVTVEPADGTEPARITPGLVDASGSFKTGEFIPGKYVIRVSGQPQPWILRSAVSDGKDGSVMAIDVSSDTEAVVTLTDKPARLTGTVRSTDGPVDPDTAVLIFPAAEGTWVDYGRTSRQLVRLRPGSDGTFTSSSLPAGDYYAIAIPDELTREWPDPKFLARLAALSTPVRVANGETRTVDLRTTRPR